MPMWKLILVVATLPLFDCTAKKSPAAPPARRPQINSNKATAGKRSRVAAADARKRTPRGYPEEEDDFAKWSDSGSGEDSGAWDSYDDATDAPSGDRSRDQFFDQDSWDTSGRINDRRRRQQPPPTFSSSSSSAGPDDRYNDDLYSSGSSVGGGSSEGSFWGSSSGGGGGGGRGGGGSIEEELDLDSWDSYSSAPTRRSSAQQQRRPRASAWTGDDSSSGGGGDSRGRGRNNQRRPSGRGAQERRGRARDTAVERYQRGRAAGGGFALRMPAVSSAAFATALRRQMGTAREAVGQAGTLAASTSKKLTREVKLAVSGSWESALLKVTWPDDLTPEEALVDSLVEAVKTFKLDRDVTKNSAEHRVLMRKLWTKMSELDWRTVSKAIYLFHAILRELSLEQHAVLKIFLGKMSREWDKRTGCRYFDLNVLCGVNEEGAAFRSFVDRYGTYVFKRAEGFNARFQELDGMRSNEGWEHVVTVLAKAQKAIELGVSCQPEPEEETELTVLCLLSTADDVRQLWRRFHSALAWVLEEAEGGDLFDGVDSAVVAECLDEFKSFYTSRYDKVESFLVEAEELLGIYGLHVPDLSLPPAHDFSSGGLSSATAEACTSDENGNDNDNDNGYHTEQEEDEEDEDEDEGSDGSYDDSYDEDNDDDDDDDDDGSDQDLGESDRHNDRPDRNKHASSSPATAAATTSTATLRNRTAGGKGAATKKANKSPSRDVPKRTTSSSSSGSVAHVTSAAGAISSDSPVLGKGTGRGSRGADVEGLAVGATTGFPGDRQGACEAEGAWDEAESIAEEVRPAVVAMEGGRGGGEGGRWADSEEGDEGGKRGAGGGGEEDSAEEWEVDGDEHEDEDGAVYFDDDDADGDGFDENFDRC